MKKKRRLRTREELLDLQDKYFPGSLGNLLRLGAIHFRQTSRKNGEKLAARMGVSTRWRAGAVMLVSGTVLGLSLLTARPVSARQAGPAPSSSETIQPAVSPVIDAQERVYKQAGALADAGKLAESEELLNNLLGETKGPAAQILKLRGLQLRGDVRARMGRFIEAVSDFEQVVQTDPYDHQPWFRLTLLLAQTGDVAKYRARCKEMLHRFSDTTDPAVATRIAKSCLVMPSVLDAEDVVLAERLADAALALTPPGQYFPWRGMTAGLAEYRRGEFARAGEIIEGVGPTMGEGNGWSACKADVFLISAMTHQKLKETDKARAAFDQGRELARSKLPSLDSKDLHPDWWDVLFANMLMSEAGKSIDDAKPSQP